MNNIAMAARNLGRNKRRSLLAILSVSVSIYVVVFADGFISGVEASMVRNATKNDTGHVEVVTTAYRERERFMPASAALGDSRAIAAAILRTPGLEGKIETVEARARFGVVLSSATATKAAMGIAGDSEAERGLLMLDKSLLPGSSYCDTPGTAIVGARLAKDLGLGVGDTLKVVAEKADYGMGFKKFRIAGLFRTGQEVFDDSVFQVGLGDAQDLLGLGAGASQLIVMLKDPGLSDKAAKLIGAGLEAGGFKGLSVRSWTGIGETAQVVQLLASVYFMIEVIIAFLGAFIIANVMMMVVLERRKEIGILKSMGMEKGRILGLFLAEGVMLGLVGGAIGAALGIATNAALAIHGMDFSKLMSGSNFPMDSIVRPGVDPGKVLALFAMGVAISAIVAFLPSRSAAQADPIEAIRSV